MTTEKISIRDQSEEMESMTDEDRDSGLLKFNIPDSDDIYSLSGEGVWGWASPEDKKKYNDDNYKGKMTAILLNTPLEYYGLLFWGAEVRLQCHGGSRPTLDPEWITEVRKSLRK